MKGTQVVGKNKGPSTVGSFDLITSDVSRATFRLPVREVHVKLIFSPGQ